MPKKSSIAIFLAATSALAITTSETNTLNAGENDLGGLKEWNTDMPVDADFVLDAEGLKLAVVCGKWCMCIGFCEVDICW